MVGNSKQNILWIGMTIVWWLGSAVAWLGVVSQSDFMEPNFDFPQPSIRSSLLMGTGLFVVAMSVVLRLPAVTEPIGAQTSERILVYLVGAGATVNWLGVLFIRSVSIWPPLLVLLLALAAESWIIITAMKMKRPTAGKGPHSTSPNGFQNADPTDPKELESHCMPLPGRSNPRVESDSEESEFPMIRSTTTDQWIEGGQRQLSGEIAICWQEGQRSQHLVVGFVPAFETVPQVDYEADSADEVVRCLNCTQAGLRLEIKRTGKLESGSLESGSLESGKSTVAWAATEVCQQVSPNQIGPNQIGPPALSADQKKASFLQGLP